MPVQCRGAERPTPGAHLQGKAGIDLINVDDFCLVPDGQMNRFVGDVGEPFQKGVGQFYQVLVLKGEGAQLEELCCQQKAFIPGQGLHIAQILQGLDEPECRRFGYSRLP